MRLLRLALEDVDTTPQKETEMVFYAKIKDFNQLKQAVSVSHQEQYELRIPKTDNNAVEGRVRIRKVVKEGEDATYILTTKTKTSDGNNIEVSCETTDKMMLQFQYLAEYGMIKDRYCFPVPSHDLLWEFDVFSNGAGGYQEWCKIDLELPADFQGEIPPFPIELENLISNPNGARTDEEEATVRLLYDTVFRCPNPILSQKPDVE